jgi:hypothetical protein
MSLADDRIEQVRRLSRRLDDLDAERARVMAELAELMGAACVVESASPNTVPGEGSANGRSVRRGRASQSDSDASKALLEVAMVVRKLGRPIDANDVSKTLEITLDAARIRILRAERAGVIRRVTRGKYGDKDEPEIATDDELS